MPSWRTLADEGARWHDSGRVADLWWRDDDAVETGPALERLLAIRRQASVPLALAVVPAHATKLLGDRLTDETDVDLLQHGYDHVNHAPPSHKKMELGAHRPASLVLGELGTGWLAMERLFATRALPVLVPPWNRIAPGLLAALPEIGFRGLSTFGPRRARPLPGLSEVNTHVDLVNWKGNRGFVGEAVVLGALVAALVHARTVSNQPIGLLSHHLAMDGEAWDFLRSMWEKALTMPGLRLRPVRELFADELLAGSGGARGEARG